MKEGKIVTQEDLGVLSENEIDLIHCIRTKWRWGEVTITLRDGQPYGMVRRIESTMFGKQ